MTDTVVDDETIARYLLGELPAEEQTVLEQRYLADPELLDRMDAVEDDLIDEYVRNELKPEQREHFETRFLTAERLERVRMAEALRRTAAVPVERRAFRPPHRDGAPSVRRSTVWLLPLAAALFAAALLTIVWLALENRALQARNAALLASRDRAAAQYAEQARRSAELERALRQKPAPPPREALPLPVQFAAIVLSPGLSRGEDAPTLVVERDADAVRLEALLEVEAPRYDATLQRIGGPVVWKGTALAARTVGGQPRLVLTIPRERFRGGEHLLTVTAPGLVADYSFDVILR